MINLKYISRNILLTLLFVFVIFTPSIRFMPYYTWVMAILGLCTLTDRKFKQIIGFKSKGNSGFLKFFALVFLLNSFIIPLFHGFDDLTYIPLQIGILLTILRCFLLIYCLHKFGKGDILSQYSRFFFAACCIYVLFTLAFIVYPSFKFFWLDTMLTDVPDRSEDFAVYEFRYSLDGFAAFSSASVFSFACIFCCYSIATSRKINLLMIACLMLLVVGCFFYGRVSLVGMLLGALLIIWTSGSFGKSLRIAAIIVAFVLGLLALLNMYSKTNGSLEAWQEWAFAFVKQIFIDKKVTDYSATHMVEDMYYMPEIETVICGDGKYTNSNFSYYGHTDVGFMRLILYGGLFCLIFVYFLIIYLAKKIVLISHNPVFNRFILFSAILFFVLEMKGESYQRAIMMLYPLLLIQNYKNNIQYKYD